MIFKIEGMELWEHKALPSDKGMVFDNKIYVETAFPIVLKLTDLDTAVKVAFYFARLRIYSFIDNHSNHEH
jgi:hypothetical protein